MDEVQASKRLAVISSGQARFDIYYSNNYNNYYFNDHSYYFNIIIIVIVFPISISY